MPDLLSELPTPIRAELCRRGMSQRDLTEKTGTYSSTITRLVRGQGMCDVATFVRLVAWLRMAPEEVAWLRMAPEEFADELAAKAYQRGRDDCAAQIQAVLYPNDTNINIEEKS